MRVRKHCESSVPLACGLYRNLTISKEQTMSQNTVPVLSEFDQNVLDSWVRSTSVPAALARLARIVLLAADGARANGIADRTGSSRLTVTATGTSQTVSPVG